MVISSSSSSKGVKTYILCLMLENVLKALYNEPLLKLTHVQIDNLGIIEDDQLLRFLNDYYEVDPVTGRFAYNISEIYLTYSLNIKKNTSFVNLYKPKALIDSDCKYCGVSEHIVYLPSREILKPSSYIPIEKTCTYCDHSFSPLNRIPINCRCEECERVENVKYHQIAVEKYKSFFDEIPKIRSYLKENEWEIEKVIQLLTLLKKYWDWKSRREVSFLITEWATLYKNGFFFLHMPFEGYKKLEIFKLEDISLRNVDFVQKLTTCCSLDGDFVDPFIKRVANFFCSLDSE
ncbi:MAG TPA: hypothetical protein VNJ01_00670 [Bacteriovoracaceae bacterium]|nr:hypothetical protein [Bacteriovoracaceae bacterium]